MSNKNPAGKYIKRGKHVIYLDPPYVRGGNARSGWQMTLNGLHIPLWPRTKAEGVKLAAKLLDAIEAAEKP